MKGSQKYGRGFIYKELNASPYTEYEIQPRNSAVSAKKQLTRSNSSNLDI